MTEHTEQTASPPGTVPVRIDLEDFIEAVTRGVARALAAQEDVSGYLQSATAPAYGTVAMPLKGLPVLVAGLVYPNPIPER